MSTKTIHVGDRPEGGIPTSAVGKDAFSAADDIKSSEVDGSEYSSPQEVTTALQIAPASDDGALFGPEVDLFTFKQIGYLMQYFAVGLIYGGLPATTYGIFRGYLNVPGYVYATVRVIMTMPWSFKFFFGLINNTVPICGYRRKPYMVIGWAFCACKLMLLSTLQSLWQLEIEYYN